MWQVQKVKDAIVNSNLTSDLVKACCKVLMNQISSDSPRSISSYTSNPAFMLQNFDNTKLTEIDNLVAERINEDVMFQKQAIGMRNQRCYAVKVCMCLLDARFQT